MSSCGNCFSRSDRGSLSGKVVIVIVTDVGLSMKLHLSEIKRLCE